MSIKAFRLVYQLKDSFKISRMSRTQAEAIIIEIDHSGVKGYGEATDNPYYKSYIDDHIISFHSIKDQLKFDKNTSPESFYHNILVPLDIHPFLRCALDQAYWDWYARVHKTSILELLPWKWDENNIPTSSYTIGMDSIDNMKRKILDCPWPLYKIKIDNHSPLAILKELRTVTASPFMVDANGALSFETLELLISKSKEIDLVLVEQPLEEGAEHLLNKLENTFDIAGDESFKTNKDISSFRELYGIINFKLMKSGGITPVRDMILNAKNLGYKIMMGCMTESSVGIGSVAQFLPILDYIDMDGAILLQEDIASGINFINGKCQKLEDLGNGIRINQEIFNRLGDEN